ncbi:hypothetical protein AFLA_010251 [Aspergillus flavus NRRL3357]|nr:hypothetical protein AFLA_010251 [Aspergillus flavus NRRL3357]
MKVGGSAWGKPSGWLRCGRREDVRTGSTGRGRSRRIQSADHRREPLTVHPTSAEDQPVSSNNPVSC